MSLLLHTRSASMLIGYFQIIIVSKILKYIINDITYIMISYHNIKYNVLLDHDMCKVKRSVNQVNISTQDCYQTS